MEILGLVVSLRAESMLITAWHKPSQLITSEGKVLSEYILADTSDEIEFVCLRLRFKRRFYASLIVSFATKRERTFGLENHGKFGHFMIHKCEVINSSGHQKYAKGVHEKVIRRKEARVEAFMTYKSFESAILQPEG